MTILTLTDTELRRALRQLAAPVDRDHPLLRTALVDHGLVAAGLPDECRHRWSVLAELVEGLLRERIAARPGEPVAWPTAGRQSAGGPAAVRALFDHQALAGSEELRAWTMLYCRYCLPLATGLRLETVLGVHRRTLQRWQKAGLALLRRRLHEAELALTPPFAAADHGAAPAPPAAAGPATSDPAADLADYRVAQIERWTAAPHRLDERFVAPALLPGWPGTAAAGSADDPPAACTTLGALLAALDNPALVILGAPGSGKSTLLRQLELETAQRALCGADERLTYLVPLRRYRPPRAGGALREPWAWLAERWRRRHDRLPDLAELWADGRLLLLLDGLHELSYGTSPEHGAAVGAWQSWLRDVVAGGSPSRVVLTGRRADDTVPLAAPDLPLGVASLEPLDDGRIEHFLALHDVPRPRRLLDALRADGLLALARLPERLRLLVDEPALRELVPGHPATLVTAWVRQALRREVLADNPLFAPGGLLTDGDCRRVAADAWPRGSLDLPDEGPLVERLARLAGAAQLRAAPDGPLPPRLPRAEALSILADTPGLASRLLRAALALGLVGEEDAGGVAFAGLALQRYFAARAQARLPAAQDAALLKRSF
jgi:hypothetical protein